MRLLLLFLIGCSGLLGAEKRPPNVLLIVSDDLRDTLGCYGHAVAKTPHVDALAKRGVRFDRAYVQYPVCNPSRTSLLTGLRCEQTQIVENSVFFRQTMPHITTLPQLLRQNGWTTHSFGKIYHAANTGEALRPSWLDLGKSWDKATTRTATTPDRAGEFRNLTQGSLNWCEVGICDGPEQEQPDFQTASEAIQSMEELHAGGKPWMVAVGFHRPHDPFHAPRKYFDLYPKDSLPLYRDPAGTSPVPPLSLPNSWLMAFKKFSDEDRRSFMQAYLAGVSFMDAQVGRLLAVLDRLKAAENTLIIFLGDHGYHLGERDWWNKNTLFERSCRAPLIIAAPGVPGGTVFHRPVEFLDIYPTVADFCGHTPPHKLPGKSLRPVMEDVRREHKEAAFTLISRGRQKFGQSVRTAQWRFTRWSDGAQELYQHPADAEETRNLAGEPQYAPVVKEMTERLATLPPWPMLEDAETLFFTGETKITAKANLLRVPSAAPRVISANGGQEFLLGKDFIWQPGERTLSLTAESRIPYKTTAELYPPANSPNAYRKRRSTEEWMFFGPHGLCHSLQCSAAYPSQDAWSIPWPAAAPEEQLGRLRAKLKAKSPLRMVVLGDSISTGADASSLDHVWPFQGDYPTLVARGIETKFGASISLKNLSQGGMDVAWGNTQAEAVIAEKPDLLLLAFGMNDASGSRTPTDFAALTGQLLERVRQGVPECSVILVSPMSANTEWIHASPELYPQYATALGTLTGPNTAMADVTKIWTAVVERKKHLDLTGNGLNHPNDYGHRLYAETILAVLLGR